MTKRKREEKSPPTEGGPELPPPEPEGSIVAYAQHAGTLPLRPAERRREWMDATCERFAYRCLPLVQACVQGWELLAPCGFTVRWRGTPDLASLSVDIDDPAFGRFAVSHFGYGILSIQPGWLFRTPRGVNLLMRGPSNRPKAGVQALEGVIESDWNVFNATINWKVTVPGLAIRFEKGEPIGLIVPQPRGYLAQFSPTCRNMSDHPDLAKAVEAWERYRAEHHSAAATGIERLTGLYMRGLDLNGKKVAAAADRSVRTIIRGFDDRRPGAPAAMVVLRPSTPTGPAPIGPLNADQVAILQNIARTVADGIARVEGLARNLESSPLPLPDAEQQAAAIRDAQRALDREYDALYAQLEASLGTPIECPPGHVLHVFRDEAQAYWMAAVPAGGNA